MKTKHRKISIITLLAALFMVSGVIFQLPAQTNKKDSKCEAACDNYVSCTVDFMTKQGKKVTKKDKTKLTLACLNICKKNRKAVLACYKQSKNSCQKYAACIQDSYKNR